MSLLIVLHILGATVWVGGMAFAYLVLRPAAASMEPADRLALWRRAFERFFPLVWLSIAALLVSGYALVFGYLGGFAGAGIHVHLMQATGLLMMALFAHLFFAPWKRMRRALEASDLTAAAKSLGQIRLIVGINLVLGLVTVVIGAGGRYV